MIHMAANLSVLTTAALQMAANYVLDEYESKRQEAVKTVQRHLQTVQMLLQEVCHGDKDQVAEIDYFKTKAKELDAVLNAQNTQDEQLSTSTSKTLCGLRILGHP